MAEEEREEGGPESPQIGGSRGARSEAPVRESVRGARKIAATVEGPGGMKVSISSAAPFKKKLRVRKLITGEWGHASVGAQARIDTPTSIIKGQVREAR